ncbi:MAG: response regulator [Myxococcales bacterium]|nr:response regulator [Myxococcales bacterium]MCB9580023.1 response regulator [Polyangiaceae bacterium]
MASRLLHLLRFDAKLEDGVVVANGDGTVRCADSSAADWLGLSTASVRATIAELIDAASLPIELRELDVAGLRGDARRAEEALRRHFEDDLTADYVADEHGHITQCNTELAEVLGFASADQLLGRSILDFFTGQDTGNLFLATLASVRRVRRRDTELRRADGETVHVTQNVVADFDDHGRLVGFRGYLFDRTQERRLEEQLVRSQKIEAVGRLAGGVAHDFNNLLTVILNYADLLRNQLGSNDSRSAMAVEIKKASERAADLTRRLLAFGRRQVIRPVPLDLNQVLLGLSPLLEAVLGPKVSLELVLGRELGAVTADPGQLEQVVTNLVVNARDAMPDGGRIVLETENVLVDAAYRKSHPWATIGRYVLLTVSDCGQGMDADTLGHAFEPFFTTKDAGKGTGLGLASAYGIIKQHHGMIHAYSEPGVGTTIKVYLPLSLRPASSVGTKIRPRIVGGRETILIAEDDPGVRHALERTLLEHDYTVVSAASGEEAFREFSSRKSPIDLVIMDLVMPGLGGLAAYEWIRSVSETVPVVFTSGYSAEAARISALDDPRADFVAKPYSHDELLVLLRRVLDQET